MAEDQKDIKSKFQGCCKGKASEMVRKMMEGSLCTEMMKKIVDARKAAGSINCAEMLEKMKKQFGGAQ